MQKITKLSLLLVLLISKNLSAQKVDIDRSWFKVNRTLLPKSPLGDDIKYFNVNVKSNATFRLYIPDNEVVSKVDIEGFALSTKPDNAIQVNIKLNEFMIKKNEVINTRTEDVKNKEGKVISQKKYYQLKLTYTLNTEYDVINGKNNEVLEPQTIYHRQLNELTYKGEEVTSYAIAAKQYNDNGVAIRSKIINDEINNLIYRINGTLSFKYGYARVKTENFLWEMDSKKHPENEVFNSHIQHILDTFKTYTYTSKTEDFDATFGGDIEYFTKLSKLSTEDKQNEKLVQASLWNLSMIYYFNDNSVESKIYGQKLIDSEIDKKDGENIIQMANELEELFKKNNVYSTHFIREMPEPETIAVPEKEAIAAEVKEEAAPQFLAGLVITNEDKEIEGFFFNEIAKVPWGVQDGIRFIPSSLFNEGKYDKKSIEKYKPKELKGLSVDNKVYIPVEYADLRISLIHLPLLLKHCFWR